MENAVREFLLRRNAVVLLILGRSTRHGRTRQREGRPTAPSLRASGLTRAFIKPREDEYVRSLPTASDVVLVIEVADTTLPRTKVPLYARCGVPEAWVVDVNERVIHVFRDPGAAGYRTSLTVESGQMIASTALPEVFIEVTQLFRVRPRAIPRSSPSMS